MPVNLFDANYYRSVNLNLRGLSDAEALSNFQTFGLDQGLSFSPIVDLSFFRSSNSDLVGLSNRQLFDYLSNTGVAEGRKFSQVFDLNFYRNNNSDIAGYSNEQLFDHFQTFGLNEGRNASEYIQTDFAGNVRKAAREIVLSSKALIFRDAIGDSDQSDIYKFEIDSQSTSIDIKLNGLSDNVDLELYDREGYVIASSRNAGNASEILSYDNLGLGEYYVKVHQVSVGQNTNYNLNISTKLISNAMDVATPQSAAPIPVAESPTTNNFIQEVLNLTNVERAKAGLQPLKLNEKLNQAAQSHSQDMAYNDYFSHTGINGSSAGDRASSAGYMYSYLAENIAAGYVTAQEVVQGWMDSPGHRANIMNANYQEIGIGYFYLENDTGNVNYNYYWTQEFATPYVG